MKQLTSLTSLLSSIPQDQFLLSISGESGLGKTTLALQLAGFFLTSTIPFSGQCIWVQASETFPIVRLRSLYAHDPLQIQYLQKHILVIPGDKTIADYPTQRDVLSSFSDRVLPPKVKLLVIDNISHHLRYYLMQQEDMRTRSRCMDDFYAIQLFPLIMRCQREQIYLILIHEVSYNVKEQKTVLFFSQLYERLELLSISLSRSISAPKKILEIQDSGSKYSLQQAYEITSQGIVLL